MHAQTVSNSILMLESKLDVRAIRTRGRGSDLLSPCAGFYSFLGREEEKTFQEEGTDHIKA